MESETWAKSFGSEDASVHLYCIEMQMISPMAKREVADRPGVKYMEPNTSTITLPNCKYKYFEKLQVQAQVIL